MNTSIKGKPVKRGNLYLHQNGCYYRVASVNYRGLNPMAKLVNLAEGKTHNLCVGFILGCLDKGRLHRTKRGFIPPASGEAPYDPSGWGIEEKTTRSSCERPDIRVPSAYDALGLLAF